MAYAQFQLKPGNFSPLACLIPDGLPRVTLSFMKENLNSVRIPVYIYYFIAYLRLIAQWLKLH